MQQFEQLAGHPYAVMGEAVMILTSISSDLDERPKDNFMTYFQISYEGSSCS